MFKKKIILGVGITNAKSKEILEYIITGLRNREKKYYVVTPNPEFLVLAQKDFAFKKILNEAKIALADGIGVTIAGKILGKQLQERFTGVDLLENLCARVAEKPITVGFLGGGRGVAEDTAECLRKKYPKLKIGFVGEEWPNAVIARQPRFSDDARLHHLGNQSLDSVSLSKSRLQSETKPTFSSSESGLPRSNYTLIDILFVAFGAPKQEKWIYENLEKLPVRIAIGVGGAFDYISGKVPRAPVFLRQMGLEWLFRLIVEPWRIKRQFALLEFIFLVVKERLRF